jgi:hypothetical protein
MERQTFGLQASGSAQLPLLHCMAVVWSGKDSKQYWKLKVQIFAFVFTLMNAYGKKGHSDDTATWELSSSVPKAINRAERSLKKCVDGPLKARFQSPRF